MATLTNLFKLFGENISTSDINTDTVWSTTIDRQQGFRSGQAAIAKNVNSAVKSNSIVTMALIELLKNYYAGQSNVSVGLTTTVANLKDYLDSCLQKYVNDKLTFTLDNENAEIRLVVGNKTRQSVTVNNVAHATEADHAESANSASSADIANKLNISGSVKGGIVVQQSANTTGSISAGTSGQILSSSGSDNNPRWINQSSIKSGDTEKINNKSLSFSYSSGVLTITYQ